MTHAPYRSFSLNSPIVSTVPSSNERVASVSARGWTVRLGLCRCAHQERPESSFPRREPHDLLARARAFDAARRNVDAQEVETEDAQPARERARSASQIDTTLPVSRRERLLEDSEKTSVAALSEHVVVGLVGELIEELDLAIKTHAQDSRERRARGVSLGADRRPPRRPSPNATTRRTRCRPGAPERARARARSRHGSRPRSPACSRSSAARRLPSRRRARRDAGTR